MEHIKSLSIVVTTYNHSRYIRQCLESILAQKIDFPLEIIVGEDKSSDDTRQVIEEICNENPGMITAVYRDKNIGGHANFIDCVSRSRSDWIAWLEGDDFWIDPLKLQKQVELLRLNPNATLCFSKAKSLDESNSGFCPGRVFGPNITRQEYAREDLLATNFIPTCTVVFSKKAALPFPEWYSMWHLGDWTLYLQVLKTGTALFLNEITATYRVHNLGAWSTVPAITKFEKQERLIYFLISQESGRREKNILYMNLFAQQAGIVAVLVKQKSWQRLLPKIFEALRSGLKAKWSLEVFMFYLKRSSQLLDYLRRN